MRTRNILSIVLTIAITMLIAAPVSADDFIWSGLGADNLWTNGSNWLDGTAPDGDDNAIFNATGTGIVDIGAAVITDNINIQDAADGYSFIGSGSATGNFNHNATGTNTLGFLINAGNNFGISGGPLQIGAGGQLTRGDTGYLSGITIDILDGGVLGGTTGPYRFRVTNSTNTINVNEGGLFQCKHTFHMDSGTVDYTVGGSMIGPRWEYNGDNKTVTINDTGVGMVTLAGGLKKTGGNGTIEMEVGATLALRGEAASLTLPDFYAMTTGNDGFGGEDFRYGASGVWTNFDDMPGNAWYTLSYDPDYDGAGNGYTVLQTLVLHELQSAQTGDWSVIDTWDADIPEQGDVARVLDSHVVTVSAAETAASLTIEDGGQVQVTGVLGGGTAAEAINVLADNGNGGGVLTIQPGGTLNALTLNTNGTTNLTGASGTIETLNVKGGTTTIASPTITQVNATGGVLNTEGSGVANLNIDGAAVSTTAATSVDALTVTAGTLNLTDAGMTVNTATILGGGVDASDNAITVSSGGIGKLNDLSFSNPTHNIALSGANLADTGTEHTVTLSGGTTTISGLQGGAIIRDYFENGDIATGGPNAINGGFDTYNNFGDDTTTTLTEAGGMATMGWTTPPNQYRKMGIVSKNAVDVTGQSSIEATFEIDSVTFPDGELDNLKFGLADLILTFSTNGADTLNYSIGLEEVDDRHNYTSRMVGFTRISDHVSEFADGFSVVMEADDSGWSISFPDTTLTAQSGAWPTGFTFDSVFDDTNLFRNIAGDAERLGTEGSTAWVQVMRRGGNPFMLNMDSMEVKTFGPASSNPVTNVLAATDSTLTLSEYPSTSVALAGIEVADAATLLIDAVVTDVQLTNMTLGGDSRIVASQAGLPVNPVTFTVSGEGAKLAGGRGVSYLGNFDTDYAYTNLVVDADATIDWMFVDGTETYIDVAGNLTIANGININIALADGSATPDGVDVKLILAYDQFNLDDLSSINVILPDGWDSDGLAILGDTYNDEYDDDVTYLILQNLSADVVATPLPGDADGSKTVDEDDLTILLAQFGSAYDLSLTADFNDDGYVDVADFVIMRAHWGDTATAPDASSLPATTPEPATMTMLAIGGLVAFRRRRRK
jgi:hypothetical protein